MTVSSLNTDIKTCFTLKANFLPCMVLQLTQFDLELIEQQITSSIRKAPNLFQGSPIVIDLDKINTPDVLNFAKLKCILISNGMMPIGVRGGTRQQQEAAIIDGLPLLPSKLNVIEKDKPKTPNASSAFSKVVTTPIRSGMQVYAKESDLIVTAAVSPGAELFADGNIHVYGPLRGRALAGVQGNTEARIFCRMLDAELVSIAGYYLTKENMQANVSSDGMIQIILEHNQIRIEAL